jgi:hypothetical protein
MTPISVRYAENVGIGLKFCSGATCAWTLETAPAVAMAFSRATAYVRRFGHVATCSMATWFNSQPIVSLATSAVTVSWEDPAL